MMPAIKIALVASEDFFSDYGGGQVYVKNLADELIRRGENLVVISASDKMPFSSFSRKEQFVKQYKGIPVYQILSEKITQNQLRVVLEEIKPDVIHVHGYKKLFALVCDNLKIPCIITTHHGGILCPQGALLTHQDEICKMPADIKTCLPCVLRNIRSGLFWRPILEALPVKHRIKLGEKLSVWPFIPFVTPIGKASFDIKRKIKDWGVIRDKATLLIAPSQAIATSLIRNGAKSAKVKVVLHGIPIIQNKSVFATNQQDNNILRFFYVGRLCREKGVHILLGAFDQFVKRSLAEKVELHLIGGAVTSAEQRYWNKLKQQYKIIEANSESRQSLDSGIIYHGKLTRENTLAQIAGYDILVHPAIFLEVFGLDIAEVLSMGKPVIATRCGGAEMQVEDGVNGWLIPTNRIEDLVEAFVECVKYPEKVEKMSVETFSHVISLEKHVEELLFIYQKYSVVRSQINQ